MACHAHEFVLCARFRWDLPAEGSIQNDVFRRNLRQVGVSGRLFISPFGFRGNADDRFTLQVVDSGLQLGILKLAVFGRFG